MKYSLIRKIKDGEFSLLEDFRQTGRDISKFFKELKASRFEALSIVPQVVLLGCLYEISRLHTHPRYLDASTYGSNSYVSFKDDMAPGMRAYVKYTDRNRNVVFIDDNNNLQIFANPNFNKKREIEMSQNYKNANYYSFSIPEQAFKSKEFVVYAIDRDGHKSESKKLYVLDDVVVEKSPN